MKDISGPAEKNELKKILGVAFGIAVLIGGTIGVGILRTPGSIAQLLNNYWIIIACWVFGGIYVLIGVGSYAELATMLPKAGGAYNYVKQAFGNYAGFLSGWFDFILNGIAPAYFCIVIGEYCAILFPFLKGFEMIIAIAFLVAFTFLHMGGIKNGNIAQQVTSVIKVVLFVVLIVSCFVFTGYRPDNTIEATNTADSLVKGGIFLAILKSLQLIFGTYDGWMAICFFAEEDKNPGRNIPRSLFTGAIIVILIYVLINMAFFHVLPVSSLANAPLAASNVAKVIFGNTGATFVTVIAVFSLISILNAYMMIPARILFGLSRDGFFIKKGALVNKGGTPVIALLISSVMNFILILIGSFDELFSLAAFMEVIVMTLVFISLIRLRVREPGLPRPYRAWGYPWTTILMILISVGLFIGFAYSDHLSLLIIAVLSLISYPAFIVLTKKQRASGKSRRKI
jgi:APA family basic amino acid/polyamine antiporter